MMARQGGRGNRLHPAGLRLQSRGGLAWESLEAFLAR